MFIMKKTLAILLAFAMTMSLASCKKKEPVVTDANGSVITTTTGKNKASDVQIQHSIDGEYLVFKVSGKLQLEIDAWIGICIKGSYVYEDDADDSGISYNYFEERQTETEDYVFKIAYAGIEDGEYTMVLCDTDNAGYVMASWSLVLKGGKPTIDFSNFKINERPAGIDTTENPAYQEDDDDDYSDDEYDPGVDESFEDDPDEADDSDYADEDPGDEEEEDEGADDA